MILLDSNSWEIKKTKDKGRGIFTTKEIKKGTLVGDYLGILTRFVDVNLQQDANFIMQYDDTTCIIPNRTRPGAYLLNHSCSPNAWMYPYKGHTLFYAIKDIQKKEEITIHYLYPPLEYGCTNCSHRCNCKSDNCNGTMHSSKKLYKKWRSFYEDELKKTQPQHDEMNAELLPLQLYPLFNSEEMFVSTFL